jgi:hypothetical protein
MIIEVRTYRAIPHKVPEIIKRFAEGYEQRKKFSELAAFLYTDIGPLNQVIHIWPYNDMAERDRIRKEAVAAGVWPPKITDLVQHMESEIFVPMPFSPNFAKGEIGPVFEYRSYMITPGRMGDLTRRWAGAIDTRTKMSPLAMAMHTEGGTLNKFVHIWAYKSLEERREVRAKAVAAGIWPPKGGAENELQQQENKICYAAPFSPLK